MRRKTKPKIGDKCFLCILRYINLSLLNRNLLFIRFFYDVMARRSLFCQKKISVKISDRKLSGNYAMTFLS